MALPQDRVDQLKAMLGQGLTYEQIAVRLDVTRDAIAGKAKRLKNPLNHETDERKRLESTACSRRCIAAINDYWRERGYRVNARLADNGIDIETDTLDGLPVRPAVRARRAA